MTQQVSNRDGFGEDPDQDDLVRAEDGEEPSSPSVHHKSGNHSGSLLGRHRGLVRRNSLQATERSRTVSAKKSGNSANTTAVHNHHNQYSKDKEGSSLSNRSNKHLSLHDLTGKSASSPTTHLMPPPRAPLGTYNILINVPPVSHS